jgi:hypothetical protein
MVHRYHSPHFNLAKVKEKIRCSSIFHKDSFKLTDSYHNATVTVRLVTLQEPRLGPESSQGTMAAYYGSELESQSGRYNMQSSSCQASPARRIYNPTTRAAHLAPLNRVAADLVAVIF